MNPTERPSSELRSTDRESLETGLDRLRDALRRRNEYQDNLLEKLSEPGPVVQSDVQDLWLSLLSTNHEVDAETKNLIKERLQSQN